MFNVTVKGNVRSNGLIPAVSGGMAKRNIHVNNSAMPPNRGTILSDTNKLKFSDRLKAYLSSDGLRSDAELDDPYAFSDSEVVKSSSVNSVSKQCVDIRNRTLVDSAKSRVNSVNHVDSGAKSVDFNSGKTMNRLQAQIARNKVSVKHSRPSPDRNNCDSIKATKPSIIGLVNNVEGGGGGGGVGVGKLRPINRQLPPTGKPIPAHLRARRASARGNIHHEGSLQRIASVWHAPHPYACLNDPQLSPTSDDDDSAAIYQRHWFSKHLEMLNDAEENSREARLEVTRAELKRQITQMKRSKVGQRRRSNTLWPEQGVGAMKSATSRKCRWMRGLLVGRTCVHEGCSRPALPCTRHCTLHIMSNSDQVLFDHCTAKFSDNTQCSVPVFDIAHELPLCIEHARKRDNYNRMCLETKPKKPRKRIKPSAMIRPQKRNKKRKRSQKSSDLPHTQTTSCNNSLTEVTELNVCETSSAYESSEDVTLGTMSESEFVMKSDEQTQPHNQHIGEQDVVEQVLAMQDDVGGDLELVVEQTLVTQASRLLEESDFTNVLNQIPADEFNDLFAVDRNGEYEPSREETEELERALEAVDEDVKSLEKLSQTQGLLDSLLDEHTLVESLVQIPDVFHNGYGVVQCVDSAGTHHQATAASATNAFHPVLHAVDTILPLQQPQAHTPS